MIFDIDLNDQNVKNKYNIIVNQYFLTTTITNNKLFSKMSYQSLNISLSSRTGIFLNEIIYIS